MITWNKVYTLEPGFQEAYSTMEMWDYILGPIKDLFTNKVVCCPCDSDESKCVQWLKENTMCSIINFGDQDMNSIEARTEMMLSDYVITDPPFNKEALHPFVEYLCNHNIKFIILGPYADDLRRLHPDIKELSTENPSYPFWPSTLIDGTPHRVRGRIYTNIKERQL